VTTSAAESSTKVTFSAGIIFESRPFHVPNAAEKKADTRPSAMAARGLPSSTPRSTATPKTTSTPMTSSRGRTRRRNTTGSSSAVKNVVVERLVTATAIPPSLIVP
jgi:hypothetical protein